MSRSHNNQLNTVSLFDEEQSRPPRKRSYNMAQCHSNTLDEHDGPIETYGGPEVKNSYVNYAYLKDTYQRGLVPGQAPPVPAVKVEDGDVFVSNTPTYDSDYAESDRDDRRPSKVPKINKDGGPRKPRQPRPRLLKWSDNDWKNVVLGIVWACGEAGVQIPFDQAAQVVGESCTAGALQQAILKLRGKQIDEGYQIPSLRMAWTRKNKCASSSSFSTNTKPQQVTGQNRMVEPRQSLVVKLKVTVRDSAVKNDGHAARQGNSGLVGDHVDGFGIVYPMNDIHTTGSQGIPVVSGHPSDPGSSAGPYRDIVKQAVPTQYHQSADTSFDFEQHMRDMEAQKFEEYVKDHEEYDFVGNDSQEHLFAESESDNGRSSGFLPEMSSPLGNTYESPYSSFHSSHLQHSLLPPSTAQHGLPYPLQVQAGGEEAHLDVAHFPDIFPHYVFPNCSIDAQGSFADVYKTEAHEDYDFNAGHFN